MFTVLGVIICIIWMVVEESKKESSNIYKCFKEIACSPEFQQLAKESQRDQNSKKIAKARRKQVKRKNRQTRNLIIAHHCVKKYNNFVFDNKKRRY